MTRPTLPPAPHITRRRVFVDTATVWIGDPSVIIGEPRGQSWDNFCELRGMDGFGPADEPFGEGMGVAVSSGNDGIYDLTVGTDNTGRPMWAFIDFELPD